MGLLMSQPGWAVRAQDTVLETIPDWRSKRKTRDEMNMSKSGEERIVRTDCNSHCGGTCEMKVHVRDGRIIRIETGDEGETAHRMCARGRAYRQRVYAPDRLLYPLKRKGPRGSGEFTRLSWDEALVRAKEKGVRFICVDPRYTDSAAAFAETSSATSKRQWKRSTGWSLS